MLNRDATLARRSLPTMMAVGASLTGKMSDSWFDSIADSDNEASKMRSRYNAQMKQKDLNLRGK